MGSRSGFFVGRRAGGGGGTHRTYQRMHGGCAQCTQWMGSWVLLMRMGMEWMGHRSWLHGAPSRCVHRMGMQWAGTHGTGTQGVGMQLMGMQQVGMHGM